MNHGERRLPRKKASFDVLERPVNHDIQSNTRKYSVITAGMIEAFMLKNMLQN
jgi:hypothetical protein